MTQALTGRRLLGIGVLAIVATLVWANSALAQINPYGNYRSVGGISIDPSGVLTNASVETMGQLSEFRKKSLGQVSDDLKQKSNVRKISLKGIDAALRAQIDGGKPIPETMKYLAGLQRVDYVLVYPEQQDVVLVGFGEGIDVDAKGNVVGITTRRPVMLLDDLVVALRSAKQAAQGGISCSIDPTKEGVAKLRAAVAHLRDIGNLQNTKTLIEQTLGPQNITVEGVPTTSHFAAVLVAADYRMKRIAMKFEPSPVKGLPNYLDMIGPGGRGMSSLAPRWWLAPKFEPVVRDASGLAWQVRLASVKAMAEEDFYSADGTRRDTRAANPAAQRWADAMTAKYDELAVAEPIFGELRNCMEVAILAALVVKEDLLGKAGNSMPGLMDGKATVAAFTPAKQVPSLASAVKKGTNWVISASGGVMINSWAAVQKPETGDAPADVRGKTTAPAAWWAN